MGNRKAGTRVFHGGKEESKSSDCGQSNQIATHTNFVVNRIKLLRTLTLNFEVNAPTIFFLLVFYKKTTLFHLFVITPIFQ